MWVFVPDSFDCSLQFSEKSRDVAVTHLVKWFTQVLPPFSHWLRQNDSAIRGLTSSVHRPRLSTRTIEMDSMLVPKGMSFYCQTLPDPFWSYKSRWWLLFLAQKYISKYFFQNADCTFQTHTKSRSIIFAVTAIQHVWSDQQQKQVKSFYVFWSLLWHFIKNFKLKECVHQLTETFLQPLWLKQD